MHIARPASTDSTGHAGRLHFDRVTATHLPLVVTGDLEARAKNVSQSPKPGPGEPGLNGSCFALYPGQISVLRGFSWAGHQPTMNGLPCTREFVTSLLSSVSEHGLTSTELKDELLTLHVLFTKELLPALDLLDRGLVLRISTGHSDLVQQISDRSAVKHTYYVRSSQQASWSRSVASKARQSTYDSTSYYEVRLDAWTCSCPAFTFSAFPALPEAKEFESVTTTVVPTTGQVGGLTSGQDVPMCKHLLACILVAHGCVPPDSIETRIVSVEELAGWGAGWGD